MHEFKYKHDTLYCEGVKAQDLALRLGTPLYVYSAKTIIDHFHKLASAFSPIRPLICYSVKANSNLSILKMLVDRGAGLDIVSGGELQRALRVRCDPKRIVYASVGKTRKEIADAVKQGILFFNAESLAELEAINSVAKTLNRCADIALRINPDVEPKTHSFITTGKLTNKFGIDLARAQTILLQRKQFPHLRIKGLHIHIGSQITEGAPFVAAIKKMARFIGSLQKQGVAIEYLNIGGGLGITYDKETPQTADIFAKKVLPLLKKTGLKIIMEPGRFIVGNAGILITKVLYIKETPIKKFVIVDAGMNDLIRPALYNAYHRIHMLNAVKDGTEKVDIVGPICESGDFFAKARMLHKAKSGDLIAIFGTGAYGFSMSSNYNSRLRCAEVMVHGKKTALIRKRENFDDLIRNEIITVV